MNRTIFLIACDYPDKVTVDSRHDIDPESWDAAVAHMVAERMEGNADFMGTTLKLHPKVNEAISAWHGMALRKRFNSHRHMHGPFNVTTDDYVPSDEDLVAWWRSKHGPEPAQ